MLNHGEHGEDLILCSDTLISAVLDAATEVHRCLGPGLLESVYERALAVELAIRQIPVACQAPVDAHYRGEPLGLAFRADMIVDGCLLLELKSVDQISTVHIAQVINYLKLLRMKRGYVLNFNTALMKQGIKRVSI